MSKLDRIDRQILDILRSDARAPIADIAKRVGLSPAPVSRRISQLERAGVIKGYTTIVDENITGSLHAFTELQLVGNIQTTDVAEIVQEIPEVKAFYTIAGATDALIRISVDSVDHLQRIVNKIRSTGYVNSSKTLIIMHSWHKHDTS